MYEIAETIVLLKKIYIQYTEHVKTLGTANPDLFDIGTVTVIISNEINNLLNNLLDDDTIHPELKETLETFKVELNGICDENRIDILEQVLVNNLLNNAIVEMKGNNLVFGVVDTDIRKYNSILKTKLNNIDVFIVTKTKDSDSYLVTVIDSNEFSHNVYQLRSDAEGFDEFFSDCKNMFSANVIMLGENPTCLIEKPKESQPINLLSKEKTPKTPKVKIDSEFKLIMNKDKTISINDLEEIMALVNIEYKNLMERINETEQQIKIIGKEIYDRFNPVHRSINQAWVEKGEAVYPNGYLTDTVKVSFGYIPYDSFVNKIHYYVLFYLKDSIVKIKKYQGDNSYIYEEEIFRKMTPYIDSYCENDVSQLIELYNQKGNYENEKTYKDKNFVLKISRDQFKITIDDEHEIEYNVNTNEYTFYTETRGILEDLELRYKEELEKIVIPIAECPDWMHKEILEYIERPKSMVVEEIEHIEEVENIAEPKKFVLVKKNNHIKAIFDNLYNKVKTLLKRKTNDTQTT